MSQSQLSEASEASEDGRLWNEEQDELLVDFVQQKPDLWDKSRFHYRNTKLKEQIFVKLDNQLRKPHGSSEKRFKKLREKYRRHIDYRDKVTRSGRELQEPRSSWHLAKKMEFIRGTFQRRFAHTDSLRKNTRNMRNIQQSTARAPQSALFDSPGSTLSAEDVPTTSTQISNQMNILSPIAEITMETDQHAAGIASERSPGNSPLLQGQLSAADFRPALNHTALLSSVGRFAGNSPELSAEDFRPVLNHTALPSSVTRSQPLPLPQTGNSSQTDGRPSLTASRMKLALYEEGMSILSSLSENAALVNGILKGLHSEFWRNVFARYDQLSEEEKENFQNQVENILNGSIQQ